MFIFIMRVAAFDGAMSEEELSGYLSKAATMMGWLHFGSDGSFNDDLRMAENTGMKFAGRAVTLWAGESRIEYEYEKMKSRVDKIHARMPDIILEGTSFEILTSDVENVSVPDWVFTEFGKPVTDRNFDYDAMLNENGNDINHWGNNRSIPDIRQEEFQMWVYYLSTRYIDMGIEAIHFGEIGYNNLGHGDEWWGLLTRIREYGSANARRHLVLCNAFDGEGRLVQGDKLVWDFQEYPLRIQEQCSTPMDAKIVVGYHDAIYQKTLAGNNPLGWYTDRQPYMVEVDNWGNSDNPGNCNGYPHVWGYDEITWLGELSENERNTWITYAWNWLEDNDPMGHLEMPGKRINFRANNGQGNLEETIKELWDQEPAPIAPHINPVNVFTFLVNDRVIYTSDTPFSGSVRIYDLQGVLVDDFHSDGRASWNNPPTKGIYVIRIGNILFKTTVLE
jgi:hypothetical protein